MRAKNKRMLETFDLSVRISSDAYDEIIDSLRERLAELQREVKKQERAVLIVLEGRTGSGISSLTNRLYQALDPRGVRVIAVGDPHDAERAHSFMWRFWTRMPAAGSIALFDRSWYSRAIVEKFNAKTMDTFPPEPLHYFQNFETQLSADGYLIIKFFLEISEKEQKKRLSNADWDVFAQEPGKTRTKKTNSPLLEYSRATKIFEEIFMSTDISVSPWHIIEADQLRYAEVEMLKTIISSTEVWLKKQAPKETQSGDNKEEPKPAKAENFKSILANLDPFVEMEKDKAKKELKKWQERLFELQIEVYKQGIRVFIVFEGWDAAGKGGCIVRLTAPLNPRAYVVEPIAAPNSVEKSYHYLWRFYKKFSERGHITVFDRSWYGRVLVERVEGFCSEDEWKRAYHEINTTEQSLYEDGALIVKFWLHIDKDEQLRRFKARESDPKKQWKITEEDWRNRDKWDQYLIAVDEMIHRTSTPHAPWTIVPANNKYYARTFTIKTLCETIEKHLQLTRPVRELGSHKKYIRLN
jgi:polyphosphate:AMP phosphotransferase